MKEGTLELHYYRHKDDTKSKGFINIGDVVEVCRTTNESGKYGFDVVTSSIALTLLRISPSLALSCVPFLLFLASLSPFGPPSVLLSENFGRLCRLSATLCRRALCGHSHLESHTDAVKLQTHFL